MRQQKLPPFEGTTGDDTICGNERDDVNNARQGDDTVYGGAGNDILIGGDDRDVLKGEAGNDTLVGGQDNDTLDGGDGNDTADYNREHEDNPATTDGPTARAAVEVDLSDKHAVDTYGDEDTLILIENIIGTPGDDTIIGDNEDNTLRGEAGNDTIKGEEGNDTIYPGEDQEATEEDSSPRVDGGPGNDTLVAVETEVNLATPADWFTGFENLTDGSTAGTATLTGDDGNNVLTGGIGGNTLDGRAGNDTLDGGMGDDKLKGGPGRNTFTGGAGADCFEIAADNSPDRVTDFDLSEDNEVINVTGVAGVFPAKNDGDVAPKAQAGRIVAVETYETDKTNTLGTLAYVTGLKADVGPTKIDMGTCQ